jgi:hypothetical protein
LFFDYPKGQSVELDKFSENWAEIQDNFETWRMPLSSVLNAHFHAFSSVSFPALRNRKVRYNYSELFPDSIAVKPDSRYLPSGDPICTTGQMQNGGIAQISSGDSAQDCLSQGSLYDFLMHNDQRNVVASASRRVFDRLNRSLFTGFAAFITTHEYLLAKLTNQQQFSMWDEIERLIGRHSLSPRKESLSEIGRACENHTGIVIDSVDFRNNEWIVNLTGISNGESYLTVFRGGRLNLVKLPAFRSNLRQVVGQ